MLSPPDNKFASIVIEVPKYMDDSVILSDKPGTRISVTEPLPLCQKK